MNRKIICFYLYLFFMLKTFASPIIGTGIIFSNNHDFYMTFTFESSSGAFAPPGTRHVRVYNNTTGEKLWSAENIVGYVDNFYLSDNGEYLVHFVRFFRRSVYSDFNPTNEELLQLGKKTVIQIFRKGVLIK